MPKIIFIASKEEKELWVAAAHGEHISLSEWIRRAADVRAGAPPPDLEAREVRSPDPRTKLGTEPEVRALKSRKPRTGMCEHRVPVELYCKRCAE